MGLAESNSTNHEPKMTTMKNLILGMCRNWKITCKQMPTLKNCKTETKCNVTEMSLFEKDDSV